MISKESSYTNACIEILKADSDKDKIRRARILLRDYPIDSIDFGNPASGFLETALSSAFLAAYRREDYRTALELSNAASEVAHRISDNVLMRARTANNRALVLMELGDFVQAADLFHGALDVLEHADDIFDLGGTIRANLHALERMASREASTFVVPQSAHHRSSRSMHALNDEALKLLEDGRPERARELLCAAADECGTGDISFRATVLSNLGTAERQMGNAAQAREKLEEARRLCTTAGYSGQVLAGILYELSGLKSIEHEGAEAIAAEFKEAWDIIRKVSPRSRLALLILRSLARIRIVQRDFCRARSILDRGMEIYDEMRGNTGTTERELEGLFAIYRYLAELRLWVALQEDSGVATYQLMLKAKARFWAESLAKRNPVPDVTNLEPEPFVSEADFGRLVGFNGTLLEFFVGPNATFVFVVHNKCVAAYRLDLTEDELDAAVNALRKCLFLGLPCDVEVTALSRALFDKVHFAWPRHRYIMIAPDGPLWRVPMHVLVPSVSLGTALEGLAPTTTIPSASILRHMRSKSRAAKDATVLVIAHTQKGDINALADPREEIEIVRSAFAGRTLVELGEHLGAAERATPANVLSRLSEASHIHILAHAAAGRGRIEAHLVLAGEDAPNAYLTATQIQALQLRADVVVLATCESSLGRASQGEGLASLGRAFLLAGTRCVVASLWEIGDDSVRDFLRRFYSRISSSKSVARAFWEAKKDYALAFGKDDTWSGMILLGDAEDPGEAFDIAELYAYREAEDREDDDRS